MGRVCRSEVREPEENEILFPRLFANRQTNQFWLTLSHYDFAEALSPHQLSLALFYIRIGRNLRFRACAVSIHY